MRVHGWIVLLLFISTPTAWSKESGGITPLSALDVWAGVVPPLIPSPKSIQIRATGKAAGKLALAAHSRIIATSKTLDPLAKVLADEIELLTRVRLPIAKGEPAAGDIILRLDSALKGEQYSLGISDSVIVTGGNYRAVASGTATLLQLLQLDDATVTIPTISIADEPTYAYRGALIDLGRKYHSIAGIKQVIELCRLYKIRYLHLHLTDDQLFMFPSTAYPAAGKSNREFARFEPASKPHVEPYTLAELADLEQFSQTRGVDIVPEMDMPGHCGRLIADAHDTFGIPGNGSTVNIASPKTIQALTTLLNEVMDVFQGTPYVHLGADEVGLGGLDQTADYAAMKVQFPQIKSVHDLYCKFISDMHGVISKRGKKMIVWEEACDPGNAFPLPRDTLVMVWSQGRNPNDLVKYGYTVINATWTPLYIVRDNKKSLHFLFDWQVPQFGREGSTDFTTLAETKGLAGAQLCSWENSEGIEIQSMRDRLAVVAERSWNPKAGGALETFKERLAHTDAILDRLVNPIIIETKGKFAKDENTFVEPLTISLTPKQPGLILKYTLDNSLPNAHWITYSEPIQTSKTVHLRAGLFDTSGVQEGYLVGAWYRSEIPDKFNLATGKPVTVGPSPDRTDEWSAKVAVDGRSDDPNHHWASVGAAPQWLQVDLQKVVPINYINVITYWDGGRYYQFNAQASVDGKEWKTVLDFSENKITATSAGYSGKFATTDARYVRINMLKNSANPFVHIVELNVDEKK